MRHSVLPLDYHHRLTDVKVYNSSNVLQSHINFVFNDFNRLIEKQADPTGGGTFTAKQDFAYDASGNMVLVYNISGNLTDRMLNGLSLNQMLADESGAGVVSWYLTDRAGTVNDVVRYNSGSGVTSVVNPLTYGSFGNITAQSNSANQPLFAYTGQMWDADAGLYYYHARWYNPYQGRFLSQDPLLFASGGPNLYCYVSNSPKTYIDPNGKQQAPFQLIPSSFEQVMEPGYATWVANTLVPPVPPSTAVVLWQQNSWTLQYWQSFNMNNLTA